MNAASWIILAIVVAIVALAIRATFFSGKRSCGCHSAQDGSPGETPAEARCSSCCAQSAACSSCPIAKNALQPTIRYLDEGADSK